MEEEISSLEKEQKADSVGTNPFWNKWMEFRLGRPTVERPHFYHLVDMTPLPWELEQFTDLQPRALVLDLMSRAAYPASWLTKDRETVIAGYIATDEHPLAVGDAGTFLRDLGVRNPRVLRHDLEQGLPPLDDFVRSSDPASLQAYSILGMTYLSDDNFLSLAREVFEFGQRHSLPTTLDITQLSKDRFDPLTLTLKFLFDVGPRALRDRQHREFGRALKAIVPAIAFGRDVRRHLTIRKPEETIALLKNNGFVVEKVASLLWDQATGIRISG